MPFVMVLGNKMFQKQLKSNLRLFPLPSTLGDYWKLVCIFPMHDFVFLFHMHCFINIRCFLWFKTFQKWHHAVYILLQLALWLSIRSEILIY